MIAKMSRKLNLAKITGKNLKIPESFVESVTNTVLAPSATQSPYFSPVAGKKSKSGETKLSSIRIEKKLSSKEENPVTRKHIKVEYDENKGAVGRKKEIKEKTVKQAKKRSSNEQSAATKTDKIKTEPKIKIEDSSSKDSVSLEKQVKWEPKNWHQLLANIREMRKEKTAPVDTMGCDKCFDEYSDEKTKRFHHLIALMLSSQTKDAVTYDAMVRLKHHGLTPEKIIKTSTAELEQLLYPVGFYKTKAKHIQKTSQVLVDKFDSDIPNDIKGLVSLPGVGPKMAHICMRVAWNIVTGIGVDTHVHRIANRLKWMPKETKEPEQTRIALEKWLPFEDWSDVNELLVGFGQTICTPINPKCSECLNAMICPASNVKKNKTI